jgi:F0F1-type ATP synthase assembly protein I
LEGPERARWHHQRMKSQSERDAQTVTIATTLALVVGGLLIGAAVVWLLDVMADPPTMLRAGSSSRWRLPQSCSAVAT